MWGVRNRDFGSGPGFEVRDGMENETNPGQFNACRAKWLDGQYTIWGKVTAGMKNVDRIKCGESASNPDRIITAPMAGDA